VLSVRTQLWAASRWVKAGAVLPSNKNQQWFQLGLWSHHQFHSQKTEEGSNLEEWLDYASRGFNLEYMDGSNQFWYKDHYSAKKFYPEVEEVPT
jgi:hypothetical protein